jgi:hypothetical protein
LTTTSLPSSAIAVRKEEEEQEYNTVFERKLDLATAGLHPYIRDHLLTKILRKNAAVIIDYTPFAF